MIRRVDGRIYNAAAAANHAECRERGAQKKVDVCIEKCLCRQLGCLLGMCELYDVDSVVVYMQLNLAPVIQEIEGDIGTVRGHPSLLRLERGQEELEDDRYFV